MQKRIFLLKASFVSLLMLMGNSGRTQSILTPAIANFNPEYFKNKTVFHKLTWIDQNENIYKETTLKLVSRIDSVNKKIIYLQVRNDDKRDSTIAEMGSLKPIYTSSYSGEQGFLYDYSQKGKITYKVMKGDKVISAEEADLPSLFFDGFVSEYMLGALPIKIGYHTRFETYRPDLKRTSETVIKNAYLDILITGSKVAPVYILTVENEGLNYLVWIDKQTKEVLKTVFSMPNGGTFVKQRI